jgi:hypothetical protein
VLPQVSYCQPICGLTKWSATTSVAHEAPLSDEPYRIDIGSIGRAFPPGVEPPTLLLDFASWLEGRNWGTVGCFSLVGDFTDQAPIVDGGPLRKNFALFMRLPEGSVVGLWFPPGTSAETTPGTAPVVVLGSEGQHEILAPSLAGFLAKIALCHFTEESEWSDFVPHEDSDDASSDLADWLTARLGVPDLHPLTQTTNELPNFTGWMDKWCSDREDYWAAHPAMLALSRALKAHKPKDKKPWTPGTSFEIAIVGEQYQIRVLRRGRQPIDEAAAIEPILHDLREELLREYPDLGPWQSMTLVLNGDGRILPSFEYRTRP